MNITVIYLLIIILEAIALTYMLIKKILLTKQFNQESENLALNFEKHIKERVSEIRRTNKDLYKTNILLTKEKEKAISIIENMGNGLILINEKGIIEECNEIALNILKHHYSSLVNKDIFSIITSSSFKEKFKKIISLKSNKEDLEQNIDYGDNKVKIININLTLGMDKKGNSFGIIAVLQDVTQPKELNHLKDNFIRTVSHELRTPLTPMMGFIEVLLSEKRGPLNNEQKEYINVIKNGNTHLKNLVDDLLNIVFIDSGRISIKVDTINYFDLCKEIYNEYLPKTKDKHLKAYFPENDTLPHIVTDADKVRKIFSNLLDNAVKFTHAGNIEIKFKSTSNTLITEIHDTGIGISSSQQKVIFDRFRQADTSSTRLYEGMGIGLSLTRELLTLLGGSITIKSILGKGSIFKYTLPLNYNIRTGHTSN